MGDLSIDRRILLKCIFKEQSVDYVGFEVLTFWDISPRISLIFS
jgi:hypothetical protein